MLDKDRFFSKVNITDSCWLWIASTNEDGYGRFWIDGKMEYAHRVSYEFFFGEIPSDLLVCHTCDNPACVNPEHLFLGTVKDNMQDALSKGRLIIPDVTGMRFPNRKRIPGKIGTDDQTQRRIIELNSGPRYYSIAEIARKCQVSRGTVESTIKRP